MAMIKLICKKIIKTKIDRNEEYSFINDLRVFVVFLLLFQVHEIRIKLGDNKI